MSQTREYTKAGFTRCDLSGHLRFKNRRTHDLACKQICLTAKRFGQRCLVSLDTKQNRGPMYIDFLIKKLRLQNKMAKLEQVAVGIRLTGVSSLLLLAAASRLIKRKKRKKRTVWVRDWLSKRESNGAYNQLMAELRLDDTSNSFRPSLRMNCSDLK